MRSILFAPADQPRKIEKALASAADAVVLDLEDSVAPTAKAAAREAAAQALALAHALAHAQPRAGGPRLMVRVNGLDTPHIEADLDAVAPQRPFAIMLPKARGGDDVQHLAVKLAVREAESGLDDGAIGILPLATETAGSLFRLGTYAGSSRRLIGLAWSAEDLAADLGAQANRVDGRFTPPFLLARNMALFAAVGAGLPAFDAVFRDHRDLVGLRRECAEARRDGFCGKLAIHPDQAVIINEAFAPSPDEAARAQRIADAFAAAPDAGVLSVDGAMVDRAHLAWARRVLSRMA
jgi:citrate lyase subunit beta / citryl-CoA lyase